MFIILPFTAPYAYAVSRHDSIDKLLWRHTRKNLKKMEINYNYIAINRPFFFFFFEWGGWGGGSTNICTSFDTTT